MCNLIYIDPRNNPDYHYFQVLSNINTNFSGITSGCIPMPYLSITGGTISGGTQFINNLSAGTIYSGSTNLYNIFVNKINSGSNIVIGGTSISPIISVTASPYFNNLNASGSTYTSQLYVENKNIFLNYSPISMISTSLGAGLIIQDGSGILGTNVFFDIRGDAATIDGRSFTTNLNDIRIRESGSTSSPNGARVLAEFDFLDAGEY